MDKPVFEQFQLSQKRKDKVDYGICAICGEDNPSIMKYGEMHHIFGNKESNETTRLCPNHHHIITEDQNKLAPQIRSCKTRKTKMIYVLRSIGTLLKLIGSWLIKLSEELEVEENENNKHDSCKSVCKEERTK